MGFNSALLTVIRDTAAMLRPFHSYVPFRGPVVRRRNGVPATRADGRTVAHALGNLAPRRTLFVKPGAPIYRGMIVGKHTRSQALDVDPPRGKQLTNTRAAG